MVDCELWDLDQENEYRKWGLVGHPSRNMGDGCVESHEDYGSLDQEVSKWKNNRDYSVEFWQRMWLLSALAQISHGG